MKNRFFPYALMFVSTTCIVRAQVASPNTAASRPPTVKMAVVLQHLATHTPIDFPAIAKAAHVRGLVVVGVEIDEAGKVTQAVPLSGPEMLRSAALTSVQQWTFHPILIDGKAATVRSAIQIMFNDLNGSAKVQEPKAQ